MIPIPLQDPPLIHPSAEVEIVLAGLHTYPKGGCFSGMGFAQCLTYKVDHTVCIFKPLAQKLDELGIPNLNS